MSLIDALAVSGFGFAIVFIVLIVLSGILKLQSALFLKFFSKVNERGGR